MMYRVRKGRLADLPYLRDVELAADKLFPKGRVPDTGETFPMSRLEGAVRNGLLLIAEAGDAIVGFAASEPYDNLLHLHALAVHPDHGKQGLGRKMVLEVIEESRRRGLAGVTLTTFEDLRWNAPFYKKLGFRILDPKECNTTLESLLSKERESGMKNRVAMLHANAP